MTILKDDKRRPKIEVLKSIHSAATSLSDFYDLAFFINYEKESKKVP